MNAYVVTLDNINNDLSFADRDEHAQAKYSNKGMRMSYTHFCTDYDRY